MSGRVSRFHFTFAICFGGFVTNVVWLLISPASPVREYLRHTYDLPSAGFLNFVSGVQIIPTFLAMMIGGEVHRGSGAAYWFFAFAQWFVIGFGLSYPAGRMVSKLGFSTKAMK
jgi:hypothetical protein